MRREAVCDVTWCPQVAPRPRSTRRRALTVATLAFACVSMVACGSPSSVGGAPGKVVSSGSVSLPPGFDGLRLVIPQVVGSAPYGYFDGAHKLTGFDPDLSVGIGTEIGHTLRNVEATFENSLLGLQRGVYAAVPGADVTPDRLKTFDFAVALRDHYGFEVLAGSPDIANSMTELCGLRVGAMAASSGLGPLSTQSSRCQAEGKRPLTIQTFPDEPSIQLALRSGHIDAATDAVSVQDYLATVDPGRVRVTGPSYNFVDIGFATLKGNGMAAVIAEGLNRMIADGSYQRILRKYGAGRLAIDKATVVARS
jgi:polar amino acid transport system substrate-binding protein